MARHSRLIATGLILSCVLTACSKGGGGGNPTGIPPGGGRELNSGSIGAGGTFPHTFGTAGSFPYHCEFHSPMAGSVTVSPGAPATASVSIVNSTSTGFSPASATVGVGGTVTWTNKHNTPHTVTSN